MLIILILVAIIVVPLFLMYFFTNYDRNLKKIDSKIIKEKARISNKENAKLLGFIFILGAIGMPFLGKNYFGGLPIWAEVSIGFIGLLLINYSFPKKS